MKLYIKILLCMLVLLAFSCSPTEKDIFEDTSNNRIDAALKAYQDILVSAENGWLMKYYPSPTLEYGGYNILLSFNGTKVTVAGDIAEPEQRISSLYTLTQSSGPLLTFDTYNDIIHHFSNPRASVSGHGTNGYGMEGDFEFLIMEASPDSIILMGKKTSNKIIMLPVDKSTDWLAYLSEVKETKKSINEFGKFDLEINDEIIGIVSIGDLPVLKVAENEKEEYTLPFIFTTSGFELEKPLILDGDTIKYLNWNANAREFNTSRGNVKASVSKDFMAFNDYLGDWVIEYNDGETDKVIDVVLKANAPRDRIMITSEELPRTIFMSHNKERGAATLHMHYTTKPDGNLSLLCLYDSKQKKTLYLVTPSLICQWDGKTSPKVLNFIDSGEWGSYIADGVVIEVVDEYLNTIGIDGYLINMKLTKK